MAIETDQIFEWVMAPDVRDALAGIPEADTIHGAVVESRKELVRTAVGVALLEHYEEATQRAAIARTALQTLGMPVEAGASIASEQPEDVLLGETDFDDVGISMNRQNLGHRVWNVLLRGHDSAVFNQRRANEPDLDPEKKRVYESRAEEQSGILGLVQGGRISWRKLKELEDSGALEDVKSIGASSIALVQAVVAARAPTPDN